MSNNEKRLIYLFYVWIVTNVALLWRVDGSKLSDAGLRTPGIVTEMSVRISALSAATLLNVERAGTATAADCV